MLTRSITGRRKSEIGISPGVAGASSRLEQLERDEVSWHSQCIRPRYTPPRAGWREAPVSTRPGASVFGTPQPDTEFEAPARRESPFWLGAAETDPPLREKRRAEEPWLTIARPAGASSFWNIPTLKRLSASAAALAFQLHPVAARDSLKPGFHSWRAGLLVFGTLQPRVSLARS
jgi:hypothetical protein